VTETRSQAVAAMAIVMAVADASCGRVADGLVNELDEAPELRLTIDADGESVMEMRSTDGDQNGSGGHGVASAPKLGNDQVFALGQRQQFWANP
jgi:hypothetical protein